MLTAFVTSPPSSAATTCSATITPARSCASSVEAARCGVTIDVRRAEQRARRTAPAGRRRARRPRPCPTRAPSTSAPSSTSSPRAALMIRTPSFIFAIESALITPRVSSFSGRCRVRKSARASDAVECVAARRRARGSARRRRTGRRRRRASAARRARRATCWPIRPKPRMPSVFSASSTPPHFERSQRPADKRRVRLRDVARERDQQADRVLGRRDDVRLGRVCDDDPLPGRRVDVDVVDPHPGAADHLQVRRPWRSGRRSASWPSGSRSRRSCR